MPTALTDLQWITLVVLARGWREVAAKRYATTVNSRAVGVLERAGLVLTWDSAIGCRRAAITSAGSAIVKDWLSDAGHGGLAHEVRQWRSSSSSARCGARA